MKKGELMLGDWYKWSAERKDYFYQVKPEDFTKDYVTNFNPIPLTPEVLEKNGFNLYDGEYVLPYEYGRNSNFSVFVCMNPVSVYTYVGGEWVTLMYVHQLQHTLRLCRLNELADNFKV